MIENTIEIEGTLEPDGRIILDEKPTMAPGRVRVALQPIGSGTNTASDIIAVLNSIRSGQTARGHVARTKEEIDAAIDAMRGEDEERMQAIERLHFESQRDRSGKPS